MRSAFPSKSLLLGHGEVFGKFSGSLWVVKLEVVANWGSCMRTNFLFRVLRLVSLNSTFRLPRPARPFWLPTTTTIPARMFLGATGMEWNQLAGRISGSVQVGGGVGLIRVEFEGLPGFGGWVSGFRGMFGVMSETHGFSHKVLVE